MHFLAYCLSYGIWAAWWLTEGILFPLAPAAAFTINTLVKAAVWLTPVFFVFFKNETKKQICLKTAFCSPFPWHATLVALCLTVAVLHTAHIFLSGIDTWGIFHPIWIFASLSAALIEEISFRGFLFNGQAALYGTTKAAVLNGIMFAVYHYPEFIIGQNLSAVFELRFWVIFVMGTVFSLTFAKWKNLTMNIVIHFIWNMLCFWFALA